MFRCVAQQRYEPCVIQMPVRQMDDGEFETQFTRYSADEACLAGTGRAVQEIAAPPG